MAKPIKDKEEMKQVATISAESESIGKIIADTIEKIGKDGVVTVEESQTTEILPPEIVQGLEFDKGYVSAYMVTNPERMEAEIAEPAILVTDKKISSIKEILPFLEKIAQSGKKDVVIIADDIEGEALSTFIVNKVRGAFNILGVKAPGYGDRKKDMLADIALVVGAKVVSEEIGLSFEKAEISVLGRARKIISTKDKTTIIGGKGKKTEIEARIAQIKNQKTETTAKYDIEKLNERIAKLSGGVAVIRVGAATETEMKYLKLKVEDAVNATKAAIEEGIVAGGGVSYVRAAEILRNKKEISSAGRDIGYGIVKKALEAPLRQIVKNAGEEDGSAILQKIKENKDKNYGWNAKTGAYGDMLKMGIIDPVKVTRTAIENAVSAAAILLTTEVAIADEPEEKKVENHNHGGEY